MTRRRPVPHGFATLRGSKDVDGREILAAVRCSCGKLVLRLTRLLDRRLLDYRSGDLPRPAFDPERLARHEAIGRLSIDQLIELEESGDLDVREMLDFSEYTRYLTAGLLSETSSQAVPFGPIVLEPVEAAGRMTMIGLHARHPQSIDVVCRRCGPLLVPVQELRDAADRYLANPARPVTINLQRDQRR